MWLVHTTSEGNYHSWISWNHWVSIGVLVRWLSWFRMLNCWWAVSPRSQWLSRSGLVLVTPGIWQAQNLKLCKADRKAIFQRPALINGSLEWPVLMAKITTMLLRHATNLVLLTRCGHTLSATIKANNPKWVMMWACWVINYGNRVWK